MSLEEIKMKLRFLGLEIQKLMGKKPDWIVVHHAAGNWTFDEVNAEHTTRFNNFISSLGYGMGYQYWIDFDGTIKQARHDLEEGAHTIGVNKNSIGICLRGNFNDFLPNPAQLKSLKELIDKKKLEYGIENNKVEGHKFFANKDCPGHRLYKWLIATYPNA